MSDIKALGDEFLTDFLVDGVPASGANPPVKAKGRAVFAAIDDAISIVQTNIRQRAAVRIFATANIALASIYNGQTVDGVVVATGDAVGLGGQNTPSQNGVVIVPATTGTPARRADLDASDEIVGSRFFVSAGTQAGKTWGFTNATAPVIGTDALTLGLISAIDTSKPAALDAMRAKGANIAAAATTILSAATGDLISVTGAGPITSFGVAAAGVERKLIAVDGLTIKASTNMILPGGFDLVVGKGDTLTMTSVGAGGWICTKAPNGPALRLAADETTPGLTVDPTGIIIRGLLYADKDGVVHLASRLITPADADYPDDYVDATGIRIPTRAEAMLKAFMNTGGGSAGVWGPAFWAAQDARGAAYGAAVAARPIPDIANVYWDYNVAFSYGQSRSPGLVSHPPKTLAPPAWGVTAKSIGTSVRPTDESNAFIPMGAIGNPSIGAFTFQPLIATVDIDDPGGGRREDPVTRVATEVTDGVGGEAPVVGFIYSAFKRWNESRGELTGNPQGRIPVGVCLGFGGQTMQDLLSDSNIPSHPFSTKKRAESYFNQLKALADTLGKTVGMFSAELFQGEANSGDTYAVYRPLLDAWKAFTVGNLQVKLGQTVEPIFFLVQVTEHWVDGKPAIPQAHNDFALANQNVFMTAPSYATPSKMTIPSDGASLPSVENGHKDANASRWHGEYQAKVWHKIVVEREYWEHMHLLAGTFVRGGNQVLLTWHTPVGQIARRPCWEGYRPQNLVDWGIVIKQGAIAFGATDISILGTNSILVTLDGNLTPVADLAPGLTTNGEIGVAGGRTNIWDSDPAVGRFVYEPDKRDFASRTPVTGNMTAQEVAILADVDAAIGPWYGKPYPLFNAAAVEVFALTEIAN